MTAVAVLRVWKGKDASGTLLYLWCPACDDSHSVEIERPNRWTWDGRIDAPTISPSIKVEGVQWAPDEPFHRPSHRPAPGDRIVCHSYVRNGRWEFLADCTHDLAGQTVPLPPLPDWLLGAR